MKKYWMLLPKWLRFMLGPVPDVAWRAVAFLFFILLWCLLAPLMVLEDLWRKYK